MGHYKNFGNGDWNSLSSNSKIITASLKRLFTSLLVIFLLVTFIFILIRLSPGDPIQKFISPQLNPKLATQIMHSFSLDKPILQQYSSFVKNLFVGDFGISYNFRQPVLEVIWGYFTFTFFFATAALIIQFIVSLFLVRFSYMNTNGLLSRILQKLSLVVYVIPSFVLGLILIYFFSVKLDFLPTSGIKSIYFDDLSLFGKLQDFFAHIILPLTTLTLAGIAVFYRYLRDNVEEINDQTYITNLKSMGLGESKIFYRHILPNSLRPLISIAGIEFGILLGGALITEVIFSLPGMGRLTVSAIFNRDFPLVVGCSFVAGLMMIISNLIADLIKIKIDKRFLSDLLK